MELVVGRVLKPHGIRGELVTEVRTDSPDERFAPGAVLVGRLGRGREATDRQVTVEAARPHSGRLLLRIAGVQDREGAEELRGMLLLIDSASLPDPEDPDEFHDHQLIGLAAHDTSGERLGDVVDVLHTPAGELLSVRLVGGGEALVPFVAEIVPEVDTARRRCVISPPEGLLELGES